MAQTAITVVPSPWLLADTLQSIDQSVKVDPLGILHAGRGPPLA